MLREAPFQRHLRSIDLIDILSAGSHHYAARAFLEIPSNRPVLPSTSRSGTSTLARTEAAGFAYLQMMSAARSSSWERSKS
jgi:hypothetical protein